MIVGMTDAYSIYHTITNRLSKILLHMTYFQYHNKINPLPPGSRYHSHSGVKTVHIRV